MKKHLLTGLALSFGMAMTGAAQADITIAVMWRFIQHSEEVEIDSADYPALAAFSERAEALPEFLACPLSS